jgi:hypothetical protein
MLLIFYISQLFAAECGDVNSIGDVDIVDVLIIAQYYVGLNPANIESTVIDVDGNSAIDIVDALMIAQYYVGLIDSFTGCSATTPIPVESETVFAVNYVGNAYTGSDSIEYAADTGYS